MINNKFNNIQHNTNTYTIQQFLLWAKDTKQINNTLYKKLNTHIHNYTNIQQFLQYAKYKKIIHNTLYHKINHSIDLFYAYHTYIAHHNIHDDTQYRIQWVNNVKQIIILKSMQYNGFA